MPRPLGARPPCSSIGKHGSLAFALEKSRSLRPWPEGFSLRQGSAVEGDVVVYGERWSAACLTVASAQQWRWSLVSDWEWVARVAALKSICMHHLLWSNGIIIDSLPINYLGENCWTKWSSDTRIHACTCALVLIYVHARGPSYTCIISLVHVLQKVSVHCSAPSEARVYGRVS